MFAKAKNTLIPYLYRLYNIILKSFTEEVLLEDQDWSIML